MGLLDTLQFWNSTATKDPDGLTVRVVDGTNARMPAERSSAAAGICIGWLADNFGDARMVLRVRGDESGENITEHPFLERMADPWADYGQEELLSNIVWDFLGTGKGYLRAVPPARGTLPAGFEWLNESATRPFKPQPGFENSPQFKRPQGYRPDERSRIGGFSTQRDGQTLRYGRAEVAWFRYRPTGDLTTVGPLDSVRTAALADAVLDVQTLRSFARPRSESIITPESNTGDEEWSDSEMQAVEGKLSDGGATDGAMVALSQPVNVHTLGLSLRDLSVDSVGFRQEARVCGAFKLPALLLGLLVGLRWGNNRATAEVLTREAYASGLVPLHNRFRDVLTKQLLWPYYDPEMRLEVAFDYSGIEALEESEAEREQRVIAKVESDLITPEEGRKELGYDDE